MRYVVVACVLAFAGPILAQPAPAAKPATQPSDSSLKVISARVNRASPEMGRKFRNRYSSDGSPGVQMQLLLTVKDQHLMPLAREAVSIDTFVDDTYQNLLGGPRDSYYSSSGTPQVSDDGTMLLFGVNVGKPPADDAERVFVRGSISTRVAKGEPKVVTAKTKLKVGEEFAAGPFKGSVQSVSASGTNNVSASLRMAGEGTAIRNIRVLSGTGTVLQERVDPRNESYADRTTTFVSLLIPSGNEDIVLEFSHHDKIDTVKIPFEAQVDLGHAKAGPIEPGQGGAKPGADRRRPWPPPPGEAVEFGARRPAWQPGSARPAVVEKDKIEKPSVDLFSLTLGKPAADELATSKWNNAPASSFRPRGFTIARLMMSVPDAAILAVMPQDLALSSFGDDKTSRIDAEISPVYLNNLGGRHNIATISPDGQQALLTLPINAAVTPGAIRAHLAGTVKALVGRAEKSVTSEVAMKSGETLTAGPFEVTLRDIRHTPPMSPDHPGEGGVALSFQVKGPVRQLRQMMLGKQVMLSSVGAGNYYTPETATQTDALMILNLPQLPEGKQPVTIRFYDTVETVTLPFEISTSLGL